jgi:crossover junction endodeoxyribonuclease RuvC
MRVLGVDPGFDRCGLAVVEQNKRQQEQAIFFDCAVTKARQPKVDRFKTIWNLADELIVQHQPDSIAIEDVFFARNVSTALPVSEVRGLFFALSFVYNLPIFEYRPNQIKQTITGYGRADKQQVSQMVCRLLGLENIPKIDDTSDALAVALTHLTYQRQQHLGHQ